MRDDAINDAINDAISECKEGQEHGILKRKVTFKKDSLAAKVNDEVTGWFDLTQKKLVSILNQ